MFAGAMAAGLLTALLTQSLHALGKVPEDASMGVVFTSMFAVGVILITNVAPRVDLDPGCVLYGLIEFAPLDTVQIGNWEVPSVLPTLGIALAVTLLLVALFWKEFKIVSFDPDLATAMGISALLFPLSADGDGGRRDRGLVRGRRLDPRHRHADRAGGDGSPAHGSPGLDDGLVRRSSARSPPWPVTSSIARFRPA